MYFIEKYTPYLIGELARIRQEFTKSYQLGTPGHYAASVGWLDVPRRQQHFKDLKRTHAQLKTLHDHKQALRRALLNPVSALKAYLQDYIMVSLQGVPCLYLDEKKQIKGLGSASALCKSLLKPLSQKGWFYHDEGH